MTQTAPPLSLPPEVVADPDFQALWARYIEQKKAQHQVNSTTSQPTSQSEPQYIHATLQEPASNSKYQPQAPPQLHFQRVAHDGRPDIHYDALTHSGQHQHCGDALESVSSVASPSGPPTPVSATHPPAANSYVPPTGAIFSGMRRVAGSWRSPAMAHDEWSAPPTPVEAMDGACFSPWMDGSH